MLKEIIEQAIGQASMCWSPYPTGVFDSSKACKITGNLITKIKAEVKKILPKEIIVPVKEWENMTEAQQSYVKGRNNYLTQITEAIDKME